jgi:hypothetical protein
MQNLQGPPRPADRRDRRQAGLSRVFIGCIKSASISGGRPRNGTAAGRKHQEEALGDAADLGPDLAAGVVSSTW